MKTNVKKLGIPAFTHGGARAVRVGAEQELRRSVMATLLWEDQFYECGESIADRIKKLVAEVDPTVVSALAIHARSAMNLRHVPLLLCRELARSGNLRQEVLAGVIQRADELAEFVSIYWLEGKKPLSAQAKKGLAMAFTKFDHYALAKYNRDAEVKLRDVLFLTHPKPRNGVQAMLWTQLASGTMLPPDTWEVELSSGADKGETFTRLIMQSKLGAFALIRNLRNMEQAGVDKGLVKAAIREADFSRILPFRFIAAAKAAPAFEAELDEAMLKSLSFQPKLSGKTIVIVDVSGSMFAALSGKSDMNRAHAAAALAAVAREVCEEAAIYATAGDDRTRIHKTAQVPARRGMALVDAIVAMTNLLGGGGIFLRQVIDYVRKHEKSADRIIVITDEQDCAGAADPPSKATPFGRVNYLINVGSFKNGIGYGPKWIHIDGFSEAVVRYMVESEKGFGSVAHQ